MAITPAMVKEAKKAEALREREQLAYYEERLQTTFAKAPRWLTLTVPTRLGDPHHDPLQEDRKGTKKRIQAALDLIKGFAPKAKLSGYWDEDFVLVARVPKAAYHKFMKLTPEPYKDGDDNEFCVNWEGPMFGGYDLSARLEGRALSRGAQIRNKTVKGVLSVAFAYQDE